MSRQKSSSGDEVHPYTRLSFREKNKFWETGMYSAKSKAYFEECLQHALKTERRMVNMITK